jgi:hypothetical protein
MCSVIAVCYLAVLSPALQAKVLTTVEVLHHLLKKKMPIVVGDNELIIVYTQTLSHALAPFPKRLE